MSLSKSSVARIESRERAEDVNAERRIRLVANATMLCQYATEFRAKLIRECDERNKV